MTLTGLIKHYIKVVHFNNSTVPRDLTINGNFTTIRERMAHDFVFQTIISNGYVGCTLQRWRPAAIYY